jgi:hypothetical protein
MKLSHAIESYQKYRSFNSKKNTIKNYNSLFTNFNDQFGKRELKSITPEDSFLSDPTHRRQQSNHQAQSLL